MFLRGDKNPAKRPEVKEKIAKATRGKTYEEIYGVEKVAEIKEKHRKATTGQKRPSITGENNPAKRPKIRMKISKYNPMSNPEHVAKLKGENNPNWKGGISEDLYPPEWNELLLESVRERDGRICQMPGCGKTGSENGNKLDVHHIDYDKENCDPENLISLCSCCHGITNFNRNYWKTYFQNSVKFFVCKELQNA